MIVLKIIRNIAVGLFLIYGGFNVLATENEKEAKLALQYTPIEQTVLSYAEERVPIRNQYGIAGSMLTGVFRTAEGRTFICHDTYDLKKRDRTGSYQSGKVTFWVKNYSADNLIYQLKVGNKMALTYLDTVNSEAPKPKGAYFLIGFGIFALILGLIAAFLFDKERKNK